jgi:probable O-glycosylation ligase (exosortase A-associated)
MVMTTFFALNPIGAWQQLDKIWRIQLMTFVTLMLITSRVRVEAFVWIICLSLGYYGIKGGIFTIATGGAHHVYGPAGTFIGGNNEMALALIMTIPLMRYLQLQSRPLWLRTGLGGAMLLSAIAAIGSQSRGAFLAIMAMGAFLWLKSRHKIATAVLGAIAIAAVLLLMPQEYYDRMTTIRTYDQDASAMGRINAWWTAYNLAKDRPLVGGGFDVLLMRWIFQVYAPNPEHVVDVHSIYFEVLGEHGFVALGMFLMLWIFSWFTAQRVIRSTRADPERRWLADLCAMLQVSLVGYLAGGAFLGLAYFDLPYHLLAIVVIASRLAQQPLVAQQATGAGLADGAVRVGRMLPEPAASR